MTTTYDIANAIGQVRLTTGDNDITIAVFTDEEIQYWLTKHSESVPLASADLLLAWANKYATNASEETIGDYAYKQKIMDNFRAQAKKLQDDVVNAPSAPITGWIEMDLTSWPS